MANGTEGGAPDVVTFGEAMALLLAEHGYPVSVAASFRRSVAGAESTVAIGLARLGRSAAWIGKVGGDPLGHTVLGALRAEGLDLSRASTDADGYTGLLVRDSLERRSISVSYYRSDSAGSRLGPRDMDPDFISSARLLHGSGITPMLSESARQASESAFSIARNAGVMTSFDPNLRRTIAPVELSLGIARQHLALADFALVSREELDLLSGTSDIRDGCKWALAQGVKFVAVKMGEDGSVGTDGVDFWQSPGYPVRPVDTVGAGDAWAAGFLDAVLAGLDYERCLDEGNHVASMAIQVPGDVDGLPTERERRHARAGRAVVR
jgi:2-dehydro-3-deoxygluconokinase